MLALGALASYMGGERLVRAGASPTRSDPEGSSRNGSRLGRYQSLTLPLHTSGADPRLRQQMIPNRPIGAGKSPDVADFFQAQIGR
jgi:hypothetical protein